MVVLNEISCVQKPISFVLFYCSIVYLVHAHATICRLVKHHVTLTFTSKISDWANDIIVRAPDLCLYFEVSIFILKISKEKIIYSETTFLQSCLLEKENSSRKSLKKKKRLSHRRNLEEVKNRIFSFAILGWIKISVG